MMTKERFNELLFRIHNGDRSALEPIYKEYYGSMKAAAYFIVHNNSDAEDAASDAIMRLIVYAERKNSDERIDNPAGFMHSVVRSCSLNILQRNRNGLNIDDVEVSSTEDVSEYSVNRFDLIRVLSELTEEERELAIRHFMFGEKIKELSKDFEYHYDSIRRKLKEIKRKINGKL